MTNVVDSVNLAFDYRGMTITPITPQPSSGLREILIDSALSLTRETGSWGFSLREVARRAGVSHNAPYRHFADKAALLAAIGVAGYDALRAELEGALAGHADAVSALRALIRAFVSFALVDPSRYGLMIGKDMRATDGGIDPDLRAAADRSRQVLKDLLKRGAEEGSFAIVVTDMNDLSGAVVTVWSLLHGYTLLELDRLRHLETSVGIDDLIAKMTDRLIHGLIVRKV